MGTLSWQRALAIFLLDKSGCDSVTTHWNASWPPQLLPGPSGPLRRGMSSYSCPVFDESVAQICSFTSWQWYSLKKKLSLLNHDLFTFGEIRVLREVRLTERRFLPAPGTGHEESRPQRVPAALVRFPLRPYVVSPSSRFRNLGNHCWGHVRISFHLRLKAYSTLLSAVPSGPWALGAWSCLWWPNKSLDCAGSERQKPTACGAPIMLFSRN